MTRLSEVAAVESGSGFPIADQGVSDAEFPFLKVSDMNLMGNETEIRSWNNTITEVVRQRLRAKAFPAGTVIFPKIGAAIATNKKRLLTCPSCIDNNCMGVTADTGKLDPWYLYYLFRAKNLSDFASDSNPPSIRKTEVESWDIAVPPLDSQRRVVDQISRAENIVRMRREAEAKAKEIIPALFLDMFGDPATNPKGWGIESLAEVVAIESPLRTPNFVTDATEVCIGPDSIESMTGQLLSQPTVGDIRPISGKYRYRCRDVLYSKIRPALVKVALAPSDGYCSADMYPLRCGPKLQPEYLMQILLNRHFTRYALDRATRAQMPKINREALFAFRLPVPPIDLQESFARHCQGYMGVREQQRTAMGTAELAFQSLLAGVF